MIGPMHCGLFFMYVGGALLAGVTIAGADFLGADVASTRLVAPIGLDAAKNFDKTKNIDRLLRE